MNPLFSRMRSGLLCVAVFMGVLAAGMVGTQGQAPAVPASPANETIVIDANAVSHPFPHFWEQMFGSGRAILSLRQDYRDDLRAVKRITGFQYIRFHALFDDDVGLYNQAADGGLDLNFGYVDRIYDGLLANGIRPFVELELHAQTAHVQSGRDSGVLV